MFNSFDPTLKYGFENIFMIMTQDFGLAGSLFSTWIVCFLLVCDFFKYHTSLTTGSLPFALCLYGYFFDKKKEKKKKKKKWRNSRVVLVGGDQSVK